MCNVHAKRFIRCGTTEKTIGGFKHGLSYNPMYQIHASMKQRCYNPKSQAYEDYGARGIKVCDRWMEKMPQGLLNFIEDMGERPDDARDGKRPVYSIDRIDVSGDYTPENCRWATWLQQANNKRPSRRDYSFESIKSMLRYRYINNLSGVCYDKFREVWLARVSTADGPKIIYRGKSKDTALAKVREHGYSL